MEKLKVLVDNDKWPYPDDEDRQAADIILKRFGDGARPNTYLVTKSRGDFETMFPLSSLIVVAPPDLDK